MRFRDGHPVTPSDSANIRGDEVFDCLYVGGAGSGALSVIMESGTTLNLVGVTVGYHYLACKRVRDTNTDVVNIVALKI
jgi:hypothetical protein